MRPAFMVVIRTAAVIVAVLAVWITGLIFDAMNWPFFHTGGLMHGSICVLLPAYLLLTMSAAWLLGGGRR